MPKVKRRDEAQHPVAGRGDPDQQRGQEGTDAGAGHQAGHHAHGEDADHAGAGAAGALQPVAQELGGLQFEGAEHAEGQDHQQQRDGADHDRALHEGRDAAEHRRAQGAEDRVDQGHAQHVGDGHGQPVGRALLLAARADHRQGDGDHGIDAGREAHQHAEAEDQHQEEQQAALVDERGDAVGGPVRAVGQGDFAAPACVQRTVGAGHFGAQLQGARSGGGSRRYRGGPLESQLAGRARAQEAQGIRLAQEIGARDEADRDQGRIRAPGVAAQHELQHQVLADLGAGRAAVGGQGQGGCRRRGGGQGDDHQQGGQRQGVVASQAGSHRRGVLR